MSDWRSEFDDMKPGDEEALKANKPGVKLWSNRNSFLREDAKLLKVAKDEKKTVRLLPLPKHGFWAKQVRLHYNFGGTKGGSIGCPVMDGRPVSDCPMCMKARDLYDQAEKVEDKEEKKAIKEVAYSFAAKTYWLSYCIDRDHEDEGVQVLQYPDSAYQSIVNRLVSRKTGKTRSLDDAETGHDLFFSKRTEGGKKFAMLLDWDIDPDESPLGTDEAIYNYFKTARDLGPIEGLICFKTKKEMIAVMEGSSGEDSEKDGYDDEAEAKAAKPAEKPTAVAEKPKAPAAKVEKPSEESEPETKAEAPEPANDLRSRLAERARKRELAAQE